MLQIVEGSVVVPL